MLLMPISRQVVANMTIVYSIWQGSLLKGHSFTATSMKEIVKVIDELNSVKPKIKFDYFVSEIKAGN